MSVTLKSTDLISQFNGYGDFATWIRKFELVARLQKVSDLELFLPLFLNDGALAVYESLTDAIKSNYEKLRQALLKAFSLDKFAAFDAICERKLNVGESVEVYLADLRKLAGLVSGKGDNEDWVQCLFVRGLPEGIRKQLLAACKLDEMTMEDIVCRTRSLIQPGRLEMGFSSLSASKYQASSMGRDVIICYSCNKKGHGARECPEKASARVIRCYGCGEEGHIRTRCPNRRDAKNE